MSNETNIDSALNAHLLTMTDLVPVAWPNDSFDPAGAPVWLRVDHLPRATDAPALSDDSFQDYGGIYQITVVTEQGIYAGEALAKADEIIAHFPRGLTLTHGGASLRIRNAWRSAGVEYESYYSIPVSVRYRAII